MSVGDVKNRVKDKIDVVSLVIWNLENTAVLLYAYIARIWEG
jgi:hypothetical protein